MKANSSGKPNCESVKALSASCTPGDELIKQIGHEPIDFVDVFSVLAERLAEAQEAGAMRSYLQFEDMPVEQWPALDADSG